MSSSLSLPFSQERENKFDSIRWNAKKPLFPGNNAIFLPPLCSSPPSSSRPFATPIDPHPSRSEARRNNEIYHGSIVIERKRCMLEGGRASKDLANEGRGVMGLRETINREFHDTLHRADPI